MFGQANLVPPSVLGLPLYSTHGVRLSKHPKKSACQKNPPLTMKGGSTIGATLSVGLIDPGTPTNLGYTV